MFKYCKNYAGGYTTTDATSYERGNTKTKNKSRQASKVRKTKTKKGKIAEENTKKEDERRFSIFYRLVEAKGAPIIPKIIYYNLFKDIRIKYL